MEGSFRLRLFTIMIFFAAFIAFIVAIINHTRIMNEVRENNQFQLEQIVETVTYTLETLDKVYYYFDHETAVRMEANTKQLLALYEENPNFAEWNFQHLKEQLGMDIFILMKTMLLHIVHYLMISVWIFPNVVKHWRKY